MNKNTWWSSQLIHSGLVQTNLINFQLLSQQIQLYSVWLLTKELNIEQAVMQKID